jgi:hypothetical protein
VSFSFQSGDCRESDAARGLIIDDSGDALLKNRHLVLILKTNATFGWRLFLRRARHFIMYQTGPRNPGYAPGNGRS